MLLQPNSGVVVPGEMCAFVGPSGAGADLDNALMLLSP